MIPIQNIYYMLSYAFQLLDKQGYRHVETEPFHNVGELCAAILAKGVSMQVKRGIGREYIEKTEALSSLRGRIELSETVKTRSMLKQRMVCSYDEFSVNAYMNRILKTTMELLLHADISPKRKKDLRKVLVFFGEVETLPVYTINWNLHYNRNNQSYYMLISICYLVVKGLLQTQSDGIAKLMDFLDEQRMHHLYEKFILEYYRKEFPQITASASQIKWQLDDGIGQMLPVMQSDIMLSYQEKTLIIDAKYYTHTTQVQYGKHSLHSRNLYQIFTYVKNKEVELKGKPHEVSGMLLYAKTDEAIYPDNEYRMSGNRISVRTLNLNGNFAMIRKQLNDIAIRYFDVGGVC